jgi:integrase
MLRSMRKPYILYRRQAGKKRAKRLVYHTAFWDEERQEYSRRRYTGQTSGAAADEVARKWHIEGASARDGERFAGYLRAFWADGGDHARSRELAGRPLAAEYLAINRSAIENHVLPYLREAKKEKLPLARVTRGMVESIIRHLADTTDLSPSRINGIRRAITVPLSRAHELSRIPHNPAQNVLVLKERRIKRQILTVEEARKFFALDWPDKRFRLINGLAASTGLRLGECRGLQKQDPAARPTRLRRASCRPTTGSPSAITGRKRRG